MVLGGRRINSATIHLTGAPASRALRIAKADKRAIDLAPILAEVRETGATSLREMVAALNARSIPTARSGQWSAVQVQRAMARLPA